MEPFPLGCLTPKRETGILSFLSKRPEDDGRGTVIAVLDSGIDPAAPGLQVTSQGLPKVIERYDCSGSGDVDTSTLNSIDSEGNLELASGIKIKVPQEWANLNSTGKYHCGIKPLFELYTPKLKERIEKKRKEANWDPHHRVATSHATNAIMSLPTTGSPSTISLNHNNENGGLPPVTAVGGDNAASPDASASNPESENIISANSEISMPQPPGSSASDKEKLEKEDAEAKIEALDIMEKKYKDWGDIIDCVLFEDAATQRWKIALITNHADLANLKLLEEYKYNQDWVELTPEDKMTISVNVWEDGNRLEIVGICGSHGTHVASIASAYFADNPIMNGVAPGAQVISFTIGDGRLDTMETGTAISRAVAFITKNSKRIDVINMSYGEHAHWSNNGRIGQLIRETVEKYGVSWVASAGNHGPALSTVGTPPWISSNCCIGAGAYVSPEMCFSEYSLRDKLPSMPFTWSSRGPTLDGDIGVTVSAPGGAITSVPNFTLRNSQLMNGTSMAAPHISGVIALALSAAKREGISYSPFSLKRAIENSASRIEGMDALSVGAGLIQVEPLVEKLALYSNTPERDVRFELTVGGNAKGIYVRDTNAITQREFSVSVEPIFLDSDNIDSEIKLKFRLNLTLVSSASWCQPPTFLDMSNIQRTFTVRLDLDGLASGVYHSRIDAFDSQDIARGPVFCLHATAMVPQILAPNTKTLDFPQVTYEPGLLKRYFVVTPRGASQGVLTLKNNSTRNVRMNIHTMILMPGQWCKAEEFYKMVLLAPGEESVQLFKVVDEKVMEIVIGRWWAEPKESVIINSSISFKSLVMDRIPSTISYSAVDSYYKIPLNTYFQSEEISPTLVLKNQVCVIRPNSMKLNGLNSSRDTFPNSRITYELVATYNFTVVKPSTVQVNCTLLSSTLYESEYESQLWLLFDNNKRYIGSGDAYPQKWSAKVEKGEYTLRFHVRHEKRELLEKFMNSNGTGNFQGDSIVPALPLTVSFKLSTNISLPIYQSLHDVQCGSTKKGTGWTATVKRNAPFSIFLGSCISDKNMKQLPCTLSTHYLSGTLTLQKDEKRGGVPVQLIVPEAPPKLKPSSSSEKSKEDLMDQMRDVKLSWMTKLDAEESLNLYNELLVAYPNHINVLTTRLVVLETQKKDSTLDEKKKEEITNEMCQLCDKITSLIDKNTLLQYFGSKNVDTTPKVKSVMERSKSAFADAMVKKGILLDEQVDECWAQVCSFYDPADPKVVDLTIKHANQHEHYGRALKYLLKSQSESEDKKILDMCSKLGWKHGSWLWKSNLHFKSCMKDYRLF